MIFVTVGNAHQPFHRLVEAADGIAPRLDEDVVIQSGHTHYQARNARQVDFLGLDEYDRLMGEARIVVAHAGSGSIIAALAHGKPVIVMPRRRKFGEHVNDHQLEIAGALAAQGRLRQVDTAEELWSAILEVRLDASPSASEVPPLLSFLDRWLAEWAPRRNAPPAARP